MATVNLLPNADVSNDWSLSTGSDVYALVDDDHTGTSASDSSKLTTTTVGDDFVVDLQNFTEAHSSIDGVQAVVRAGNNGRGKTFKIKTKLQSNSSPASIYYDEDSSTQNASSGYRTVTFTNRTTSDGSSAWTNTELNNLRLYVEAEANSGGTLSCTYCYVIVTYTEPVATDNSIFFGTNF